MAFIRNYYQLKFKFLCLMLALIYALPYSLSAQQYVYQNKIINIFPNNFNRDVNCLTSDDQGFIWVGTNFGLYRYDGFNTDQYTFHNKDSFYLSPEINDICFRDKHLYLATNKGLYVVETFNKEYISHGIGQLNNETVIALYSDPTTGIWSVTQSGKLGFINHGNYNEIQIPIISEPNGLIITSNSNYIYITPKDNRIIVINKFSKKIENIHIFNQLETISGLTISPTNDVLVCSNKGVFKLNNDKDYQPRLIRLPIFGNFTKTIFFLNQNIIINKTDATIAHMYRENGKTLIATFINNNENTLHSDRVKLYNNQLLYPSRLGIGIAQISTNHFNKLANIVNSEDGDSRGIAEDEKYYYLCTYKKIIQIDKVTKSSKIITNKELVTHGVFREKDTLWLATEGNGLIRFNTRTYQTDFLFKNQNEKNQSLVCIRQYNKDTFLLGGYKKMIIYNRTTNKTVEIIPKNKSNQPLSNGYYRDISILNNKTLLVATPNGIFKIGFDGQLIQTYGNHKQYVNEENTNCIWINPKKQIWAGTSDGIVIYDSNGSQLTRINYKNGLAGNKIAGMIPDKSGNLWVGTYNGLSCISTSDLDIKNYFKQDGLPDNEFNHSSFYRDSNNKMVMGTMKGFIQFDPNDIKNELKSNAIIFISKIENEKKGIIEQKLFNTENPILNIKIGKETKYSKLFFCRLPIAFFSEINFNYKILKLIPQSVDISDKPMITLTDSEAGKFDIELTVNDGKGSKGINYKIITYQVLEYFYLNKWFYIIVSLFFLLLAIAYLYNLIVQKNKNLNIRKEIARDLHDEIGGSLTAISLYTELLRDDKLPTKKQIDSIQQTTRKLLLSFRDALWTLNTESDTALQFWDHIKDMVSEITGNLSINTKFEEPEGLENIKLTLRIKQNLLLAIKEGINNALKHGDNENLELKWILNNEKHSIIISNSVKKEAKYNKFTISTGIGLDSMQKRMQNIDGMISYAIIDENFVLQYHLNFL